MEIFINRVNSNSKKLLQFLTTLEKEGYECNCLGLTEPQPFIVIDNCTKIFVYENEVRKDRQLSHYLSMGTDEQVEKILKMVRNETLTRANSGKSAWSLVDFTAFEPMVKVLEAGALKYDRNNWKKGNLTQLELLTLWESLFRHTKSIKEGIETNDPNKIYDKDLGINHVGNAMCNLMFLSYHLIENGNQEIFKPNK